MNKYGYRKQRGQVLLLTVIMMVMLMGFGALSVDLWHIIVIRNQLQNAADAAALTGANYLFPFISTGPNWTLATTKANATLVLNTVDGANLSTATVQTGYWNLTGSPAGMQATTITVGANDLPAVKVTVSKAAGVNGGPVQLIFGGFIGIPTVSITAHAVAVVGSTSAVGVGQLFPIAVSNALYTTYWNSTTNSPKIDSSTGLPYVFQIAGQSTTGGSFTTFNTSASDTGTILNFINHGNPIPYKVGDSLYIAPGAKTTLYSSIPTNVDVIMPIVADVSNSGAQTITAFAAVHIYQGVGGSGKYVQARFSTGLKSNAFEPTSATFGIYTASRLVN